MERLTQISSQFKQSLLSRNDTGFPWVTKLV